jgi:hypothetical protein
MANPARRDDFYLPLQNLPAALSFMPHIVIYALPRCISFCIDFCFSGVYTAFTTK